jgi:hypothetical protein
MDESTRKEILQRVDRRKGITPIVLLSLGVLLIISPLGIVQGLMGAETWQGLTRFFLGVLFVYLAGLVMERQHQTDLMRKLLESNEALMSQLLGPDYKKKRGVELLISMLSTTDNAEARERIREQLQRVSGQDFPAEFDPWDRWWQENKEQVKFAPEGDGRA